MSCDLAVGTDAPVVARRLLYKAALAPEAARWPTAASDAGNRRALYAGARQRDAKRVPSRVRSATRDV